MAKLSRPLRCARWSWVLSLVFGAALSLGGAVAHAEGTPAEMAAARRLFEDARQLMKEGKHSDACPKLEASQRLDPGLGTEFNLADCYEKLGRLASAWALFLDVASKARVSGMRDHAALARERAAKVEPQVPKFSIEVPEPHRVEGLQVERDQRALLPAEWGTALPVDPGDHVVAAKAPGRRPWQVTVTIGAGETKSVQVPALAEALPEAAPPASPSASVPSRVDPPAPNQRPSPSLDLVAASHDRAGEESRARRQKTWALAVGGTGVGLLATAGVLVLVAKKFHDDAICGDKYFAGAAPNNCNDDGKSDRDTALTLGNVASVAAGVGAAAVVGGVVLWLTAPKAASQPRAAGLPHLTFGLGTVTLSGSF